MTGKNRRAAENREAARLLAERMKEIIDDQFLEKDRMFASLRGLDANPNRSIQAFKRRYGKTPGEYADGLRIEEAKRQLSGTGQPILEIAYGLGFESLSAFYSFFGKYSDQTPGEYRGGRDPSFDGPPGRSYQIYDLPGGQVTIAGDEEAVTHIHWGARQLPGRRRPTPLTDRAAQELREYLAGERTGFTVPLRPEGTNFQLLVWEALRGIPYGETRSYKQVAEAIGRPTACRAVGMANNHNPILIMVPCHRVVGADGSLVGYAAGLPLKARLLELERGRAGQLGWREVLPERALPGRT